jgi:DNA-binding NarL/FixJ family response regulator
MHSLGVELAAARTRILPPAAILRHLAQRTPDLLAKAGERDLRHESLDAVLNWSLDLLEPNEAEVLAAVAICPGGFDLAIARAVAPDHQVLQAIDVLATHRLLSPGSDAAGEPWYQLLETIRTKAWGALSEPAVLASLHPLDLEFAERMVLKARRSTDPVGFEIAVQAGRKAGIVRVVAEIRDRIDDIGPASRQLGQARLLHGTLTQREIEVLGLVGAGKSDGEIAGELFISPKTASVHVANAKAKLGVDTRLDAALWARERGLVDAEPKDS